MINTTEHKKFGTHLRQIREEKGLSQQQLADIANISKLTVQRAENAKYTITLDTLILLSKALKVSLPELLDFKAKKK